MLTVLALVVIVLMAAVTLAMQAVLGAVGVTIKVVRGGGEGSSIAAVVLTYQLSQL